MQERGGRERSDEKNQVVALDKFIFLHTAPKYRLMRATVL